MYCCGGHLVLGVPPSSLVLDDGERCLGGEMAQHCYGAKPATKRRNERELIVAEYAYIT